MYSLVVLFHTHCNIKFCLRFQADCKAQGVAVINVSVYQVFSLFGLRILVEGRIPVVLLSVCPNLVCCVSRFVKSLISPCDSESQAVHGLTSTSQADEIQNDNVCSATKRMTGSRIQTVFHRPSFSRPPIIIQLIHQMFKQNTYSEGHKWGEAVVPSPTLNCNHPEIELSPPHHHHRHHYSQVDCREGKLRGCLYASLCAFGAQLGSEAIYIGISQSIIIILTIIVIIMIC